MTSRKNIKIFDFNGVNVAKHWHVAGQVFAISECLVLCVVFVVYPWFPTLPARGRKTDYILDMA